MKRYEKIRKFLAEGRLAEASRDDNLSKLRAGVHDVDWHDNREYDEYEGSFSEGDLKFTVICRPTQETNKWVSEIWVDGEDGGSLYIGNAVGTADDPSTVARKALADAKKTVSSMMSAVDRRAG